MNATKAVASLLSAALLIVCLFSCAYSGVLFYGGKKSFLITDVMRKLKSGAGIRTRGAGGFNAASDIRISSSNQSSGPNFTRRLLARNSCSSKDISISQGRDSSASGIPQYVVQIVNTCMSNCAPSEIHVFCGWFASAPLVNPNAFRRNEFNDCLVNNGKPLRYGEIVRFQYANSFMYPLRFKSAKFC